MARCLFSLLPGSSQLEVALHRVDDQLSSGLTHSSGITAQDLNQFTSEQKNVLECVLKEYFKTHQTSFSKEERINKIEISSKGALEFFQKAAAQGMLSFEKKKIFFDPFVSWDLEIDVFEEETTLLVETFLKLGSLRIPLKEIQWSFFEKKGWILYRDTLRPLNSNYDPRLMKMIFSKGEIWPKEEKRFFLDLDEEGPKITCLFEEKKSLERKATILDLFGMEISFGHSLPSEHESELKEAGYQKEKGRSFRLFF